MHHFARPVARGLAGLLVVTALLLGAVAAPPAATLAQALPAPQHGVAFVQMPTARFGSPAALESLRRLHATGANWVSIVAPFRSNGATYNTFYRSPNDPLDPELVAIIAAAHGMGMRVMLQPVVATDDGVWAGAIHPSNPSGWFDHYIEQIRNYARLAQGTGADELCIGTELFTMTGPQYSAQWRAVIAAAKEFYHGPLTYSANWGDKKTPEYATIDWWDALDYIGISAYFPLSWNDFNTEPLRQGWFTYTDPYGPNAHGQTFHWVDAITAVHNRWNKPVQFTKIGFASYANSPGRWDLHPDPYLELSVQANAYDATMRAWQGTGWLTGIFWSPWYSEPGAGGPLDNGESPQNKPAEQVLHRWYSGQ
jgi:hypothetical protein